MATASTPPAWAASSGRSVMSRRTLSLWNTVSSPRWPSQCTSAVTWLQAASGRSVTAFGRDDGGALGIGKSQQHLGQVTQPSLTLSWSAMDEIMRTMCWRNASSLRVLAWDSRDSICSDSTLASNSQAVRVRRSTARGC